ncbi:unnamed protein product [Discula destructiva]
MAGLTKNGDAFISQYLNSIDISSLKETTIAVEANYFLASLLEHEPLITALGGPMAVQKSIDDELDKWKANDVSPFFVFDGCPVKGEDKVSISVGREANTATDEAWARYAKGEAQAAVTAFGQNHKAYRLQSLYHLLQSILRKRGLHFLVPPFKATAQIAYLSKAKIVGGIMGSRELLLYPITDPLIQNIDWAKNLLFYADRELLMQKLGVDESLFVDALLLTGTSFLPPFPAKAQPQQGSNTVRDVLNMLHANGKHVMQLCSGFDDVLQKHPNWFEQYCKARLIVKHCIYVSAQGSVEIENFDSLTANSHEYLGIRLPDELFHYLNVGLIRPDLLSWIIHSKVTVLPTLGGIASNEYKNLVLSKLATTRAQALGLVVPRLARGTHHYDIEVDTWFGQSATISKANFQTPSPKALSWDLDEKLVALHFPSWGPLASHTTSGPSREQAGSLAFEVLALQNSDFVKDSLGKSSSKPRADSTHHFVSSVIWRFLHLRDYVNDSHELTSWGKALAMAMTKIERTVKNNPKVPGLYEALLLAFELIRHGQLNAIPRQDEIDNGETEPSVLLASRCAVLLKLRHDAIGYTGPLRKDSLAYFSQVSAVREADRDLVDAITAHMFLYNKSNRSRTMEDYGVISSILPFINRHPNAAMGVAIKTLLDQRSSESGSEISIDHVAGSFFPKAIHFKEDVEVFKGFFDALVKGLQTLNDEVDKDMWVAANAYLKATAWTENTKS